jgi:hypothetical protein
MKLEEKKIGRKTNSNYEIKIYYKEEEEFDKADSIEDDVIQWVNNILKKYPISTIK